jgi:hypothetical protein
LFVPFLKKRKQKKKDKQNSDEKKKDKQYRDPKQKEQTKQ